MSKKSDDMRFPTTIMSACFIFYCTTERTIINQVGAAAYSQFQPKEHACMHTWVFSDIFNLTAQIQRQCLCIRNHMSMHSNIIVHVSLLRHNICVSTKTRREWSVPMMSATKTTNCMDNRLLVGCMFVWCIYLREHTGVTMLILCTCVLVRAAALWCPSMLTFIGSIYKDTADMRKCSRVVKLPVNSITGTM